MRHVIFNVGARGTPTIASALAAASYHTIFAGSGTTAAARTTATAGAPSRRIRRADAVRARHDANRAAVRAHGGFECAVAVYCGNVDDAGRAAALEPRKICRGNQQEYERP